jgi:hypothetical protein
MWVVQCHTDFLTAVFEWEDLNYAFDLVKLTGPVHPGADNCAHALNRHFTEASLVLRGEDHYLAPTKSGGGETEWRAGLFDLTRGRTESRTLVFKYCNVKVVWKF